MVYRKNDYYNYLNKKWELILDNNLLKIDFAEDFNNFWYWIIFIENNNENNNYNLVDWKWKIQFKKWFKNIELINNFWFYLVINEYWEKDLINRKLKFVFKNKDNYFFIDFKNIKNKLILYSFENNYEINN